MLHHFWHARIPPQVAYSLSDILIQWFLGIRIYAVVGQKVTIFLVPFGLGLDVELPHCADERFRAVYYILEYCKAIHGQFVDRVAILMYNLHLLHYRRLAGLAGACLKAKCQSFVYYTSCEHLSCS